MSHYITSKFLIVLLLVMILFLNCSTTVNQETGLKLVKAIELPDVSGRIDHIAINREKQIAYVAALGNNSVEVVDLREGIVIHSIKNLKEPQGIIYLPESNSIFVANGGNGKCLVFDATIFQQTQALSLYGDADNVRYDSATKKIFVGYGGGSIAIIDASTFQQTGNIPLTGHPESFQLDKNENKVFVNVPDEHEVDVIDLKNSSVTARWHPQARSNFPMALDETDHRLFIGCRNPSKLEVIDSESGKMIASLDCSGDADDVFFNKNKEEIYTSCGGGYIDVFKQNDADHYELMGSTQSRDGARTSLFVPALNELLVAAPASFGKSAALLIYSIE